MAATRKQLGAWYTPPGLIDTVVEGTVTPEFVRAHPHPAVLDPACGDGRFLTAVGRRVRALGGEAVLSGVDVDPAAIVAARTSVSPAVFVEGDALNLDWADRRFDLVIGNPPFKSQLATATTRGGSSRFGGGPYADAAAEFLALAGELVHPDGGRIALVLPQSMLASRDAASIRASIDERARMIWSWSADEHLFDAQVYVCAVAFEFGRRGRVCGDDPDESAATEAHTWSHVVTGRRGVPDMPDKLRVDGCLGDRARLNANFRDEYYGMIPAVGDHRDGPLLITSGLIDPGRSRWGDTPITLARQKFRRPRVDVARLDERMAQWARRRLVPKVLVANQTRIVEAVCDPGGDWLPAVPVLGVYPTGAHWDDDAECRPTPEESAESAWEIAAVLTSPVASLWLWHRGAGTGLSAGTIRLSPAVLSQLPWPAGDLTAAVVELLRGDVRGCAEAIDDAYGLHDDTVEFAWWLASLERIEARQLSAS